MTAILNFSRSAPQKSTPPSKTTKATSSRYSPTCMRKCDMLNLLTMINILTVYLTNDCAAAQISILTLEWSFGTFIYKLTYATI